MDVYNCVFCSTTTLLVRDSTSSTMHRLVWLGISIPALAVATSPILGVDPASKLNQAASVYLVRLRMTLTDTTIWQNNTFTSHHPILNSNASIATSTSPGKPSTTITATVLMDPTNLEARRVLTLVVKCFGVPMKDTCQRRYGVQVWAMACATSSVVTGQMNRRADVRMCAKSGMRLGNGTLRLPTRFAER